MQLHKRSSVSGCRQCSRTVPRISHVARASTPVATQTSQDSQNLVQIIKKGSKNPGSVPPGALLKTFVELEKAKVEQPTGDDLFKNVNGTWRLVYTAASKDVEAARKGQKGGAGQFVPFTAAGNYDAKTGIYENGIFFGNVANLTFKGPYKCEGRQLMFDVDTMILGLGPWRIPVQIKTPKSLKDMDKKDARNLPFFLFAYSDNEVIAARGRSGGVATWIRADTEWKAKAGVLQIYK